MITEKTVFILGAGASCPYGYPTGRELRDSICRKFENDLLKAYHTEKREHPDFFVNDRIDLAGNFSKRFLEAGAGTSIDLFLARMSEGDKAKFGQIGKLAIAYYMLRAESESRFDEQMTDTSKAEDWYAPFLNRLMRGLNSHDRFQEIERNKVTFITFNYDRSLEFYMHRCFTNNFSLPADYDVSRLGKDFLRVLHVYGSLAALPWQNTTGQGMPYRDPRWFGLIDTVADNIQTIYEMTEPVHDAIKQEIREAKKLFFLGFSYAVENLRAIGLHEVLPGIGRNIAVYGTVQGLSAQSIRELRGYFKEQGLSLNSLHFEPVGCLELLRNHFL